MIQMDNRDKYPQFCIPIAVIPATISNNVPGTELSLGADTAVNIIIDAIDELKQSASSSKRRVFVVETMGGHCGFLATFASLGGGATRCYIPEDGISFEDLAEDLDVIRLISEKKKIFFKKKICSNSRKSSGISAASGVSSSAAKIARPRTRSISSRPCSTRRARNAACLMQRLAILVYDFIFII